MKRLQELIGEAAAREAVEAQPFFDSYGLLANPFPPNRTIIPELMFDQEHAVQHFADSVKAVLDVVPQRRAMGVLGGTGTGKTHFLRHCSFLLQDFMADTLRFFVCVEFQAGGGSVQAMLRELLHAADEVCKHQGEFDLVTAIVRRLNTKESLERIGQEDLKLAMQKLQAASSPGYRPQDKYGQYDFDTLREVCRRWLAGGVLSQTERKHLGVFSRIATASMASRITRELLSIARRVGVVEGVLLCLDEVETIFTSGLRGPRILAFLQDLRYFYDEAVRDGEGYALVVLSASTARGAGNMRDVNYPLYQRLGFESDNRVDLEPIKGIDGARKFANIYIDHEHEKWRKRFQDRKARRPPRALLSDEDIEHAYGRAQPSRQPGGQVNQAPLLDALHRQAIEKERQGQL